MENQDILTRFEDVTFDGYKDVAVLTGVGYGGVNYFYDYYIFNVQTERLEKSDVLVGVSNPELNTEKNSLFLHIEVDHNGIPKYSNFQERDIVMLEQKLN